MAVFFEWDLRILFRDLCCSTSAHSLILTLRCNMVSSKAKFHLCVVGTKGTLDIRRLAPAGYVLTVTQSDSVVETIKETQFSGVKAEIEQFLSSVQLAKKVGCISSLNG